VKVSVRKSRGKIRVTVRDDGIGFKPEGVTGDGSGTVRFGLFSVREQMEHLDGHLAIESTPGRGTTATLVV
jgi:signal transduction histidine kinase